MLKLALYFVGATASYIGLYVFYDALQSNLAGRVTYAAASVVGMIIGSTLGRRWFS